MYNFFRLCVSSALYESAYERFLSSKLIKLLSSIANITVLVCLHFAVVLISRLVSTPLDHYKFHRNFVLTQWPMAPLLQL